MRKYLIHLQAIYPPLVAASMTFLIAFLLLKNINPIYTRLTSFIIGFGSLWVILFTLDAVQRFRHYRSAVSYLKHKRSDFKKLLEHEKIAWCTRESVKAACRQHSEDLYKKSIAYYQSLNIYYYHIIPNNFFRKNSPIFKISYWRVAFFDLRKKDYLKDLHD